MERLLVVDYVEVEVVYRVTPQRKLFSTVVLHILNLDITVSSKREEVGDRLLATAWTGLGLALVYSLSTYIGALDHGVGTDLQVAHYYLVRIL